MIMIFENHVKSNLNTHLLTTHLYLLYPQPKDITIQRTLKNMSKINIWFENMKISQIYIISDKQFNLNPQISTEL